MDNLILGMGIFPLFIIIFTFVLLVKSRRRYNIFNLDNVMVSLMITGGIFIFISVVAYTPLLDDTMSAVPNPDQNIETNIPEPKYGLDPSYFNQTNETEVSMSRGSVFSTGELYDNLDMGDLLD